MVLESGELAAEYPETALEQSTAAAKIPVAVVIGAAALIGAGWWWWRCAKARFDTAIDRSPTMKFQRVHDDPGTYVLVLAAGDEVTGAACSGSSRK